MNPQRRLIGMLILLLVGGLRLAISGDEGSDARRSANAAVEPKVDRRPYVPDDSTPAQVKRRPPAPLPNARVEHGAAADSSGTAWPIGTDGLWVTAAHVARGCARIFIQRPKGWVEAEPAAFHPNADVALLKTNDKPRAIQLAGAAAPTGANGYGFGFPAFEPLALHGEKLGEARLVGRGAFETDERTAVWVERRRHPARSGSLGGASGGPMLDGQGRVIGVMIAEDPRRGRLKTSMLPALQAMMRRAGRTPAPSGENWGPISPASLSTVDSRLRERGVVSRVFCTIDKRKQPRGMMCGARNPKCR